MEITVTFICHSCFLLETPRNLFLFDYYDGTLPQLPAEKPLLVFASHSHGDHFSPAIYSLPHPDIRYILSHDIKFKGFPPERKDQIHFMKKYETLNKGGLTVSTLRSTDKGVAFCVEAEGLSLYHGGDLNNWYWAEEPDDWNREMAKKYHAELARIQGRRFDLAFLPLDPRLDTAQDLGLMEFLQYAGADYIFPMHMWGHYSAIGRLQGLLPNLMELTENGQTFTITL